MPQDEAGTTVSAARSIVTIKKHPAIKAAMDSLPSWITPNGVTVFRTLLLAPIVWLLLQEMFLPALGVLIMSMLLDAVDGALAEARQVQSEFGAFLDPLADKIVVCTTLIVCLRYLPQLFVIPVGIVCFFAVVLTLTRIIRMAHAQRMPPVSDDEQPTKSVAASTVGKIKTIMETITLVLLLGILATGIPALLYVPLGTLLIAGSLGAASLVSQLVR